MVTVQPLFSKAPAPDDHPVLKTGALSLFRLHTSDTYLSGSALATAFQRAVPYAAVTIFRSAESVSPPTAVFAKALESSQMKSSGATHPEVAVFVPKGQTDPAASSRGQEVKREAKSKNLSEIFFRTTAPDKKVTAPSPISFWGDIRVEPETIDELGAKTLRCS